ncbi:CHAD domain-containing protein [Actinopolyspora saharensis]|uniref:CHAD domain-containing protein n=1 Tax=Actinopolyspora saharensis TaxID=995062 RepID=A0A1H1H0G2_9ACTN|nr:CHAD domain-containing protein [Actinopolyspora saharensis]SDR18934.1 CHAD domain-containing protein [Actinopolyspora saharensis]
MIRSDGRPDDSRERWDVESALAAVEPVPVSREDPPAEHVRALLSVRARALAAHAPGARAGDDPEELHKARVSVRRMRAVLKATGKRLDPEWCRRTRTELGVLGRALGPVRDLDVQLSGLREATESLEEREHAAAGRLEAVLLEEREHARSALLEALSSERYRELLETLARAVHEGVPAPGTAESGAQALRAVLRNRLVKVERAAARARESPTDARLHELRIRAKGLRYCAELAAPVLEIGELPAAAERLQDVLGRHQDAAVTEHRMHRLATAPDSPFEGATREPDVTAVLLAGRLAESARARRAELREAWRPAWRELANAAAELSAGSEAGRG